MAIDPNRSAGDRSRRTMMALVGLIAVVLLIVVLAGVVTKDMTGDAANGSAMNAQAPAAGAEDETAAAEADALTDVDMMADEGTVDDAMTAANGASEATVGDTAETGVQTATINAGSCDFKHLVGGTASEAANAIRQSSREFYMVTPGVDPATLPETVRREQIRVDVDAAGRVTAITCPTGT